MVVATVANFFMYFCNSGMCCIVLVICVVIVVSVVVICVIVICVVVIWIVRSGIVVIIPGTDVIVVGVILRVVRCVFNRYCCNKPMCYYNSCKPYCNSHI